MSGPSSDALTAPVSLTVLTVTKGNTSKRLVPAWLNDSPILDPNHSLWIAEGSVEHVQVAGLDGLRDLLGRITPEQALVHGIPTGSTPGARFNLVVAQKYTGEPGTIARTLTCFSYPTDRSLLMFDYDPDPSAEVQVESAPALMAHIAALWPVFGDVGYLTTTSTRSAIRPKADPQSWLTPPRGMHIYLLVTGDVARFRELLRIKLWCAGLGFCKLATANTATGVAAMLERGLVDLTVLSPERLDYVAGAQIDEAAPFYQDRPPPELHAGRVLNLDALPDATDEERQEYARRLAAAKNLLSPVQRTTIREHITASTPEMPEEEQECEITRRLARAARDELAPEHLLYFDRGGTYTAQDLSTAAGKPLDGLRLRDPQEPDYGPSQAVFHWRGGDWRVVSWAHGIQKTYRLARPSTPPPLPTEDDTADLLTRVEDEEDIDGLAQLARQDDDETHDLTKRYRATRLGLMWSKPTKEGPTDVLLTNFCAHITSQITEDDGAETRLHFALSATRGAVSHTFRIPATQFAGMGWVTEQLGAEAIVLPGMTLKDHARAAIQILSPTIERRHVYTHIGWRQLDPGWVYLHAGGAVGAEGLLADVTVEPGNALAPYVLRVPERPADGQTALLASMEMLAVAPPHIVVPLYGALWRALLGTCDLSVHLTGETGKGKSELAALAQQHWGAAMNAKSLPASWTSTANALEVLAFQAKDAVLVIDDFCPRGSPAEVSQLHGKADRVLRAQGNRSARQRLDRTSRDRPAKPPRGLIVSTGEDIPQGQSLRARICILEVTPETVNWTRLIPCQADAAAGRYAQAMAAFVQWLAPSYAEVVATLPQDLITLRAAAVQTAHRRTPELIANLALGWRYFLACAHDRGVLSAAECEQCWTWAWRTLGEVGNAQQTHQADDNPVGRFLALLRGALTAGLAHVQDASTYEHPPAPQDWGWTVRDTMTPINASQEWTPHGACIGYLDGDRLYLEPEASYSVVQRMAEMQRAPLAIAQRTLHTRMYEQKLLITQPSQTQKTILKRLGPAHMLKRVLDLAVSTLMPSYEATNSNNSNNSNRSVHEQKNQDVTLLLFRAWLTPETVTRGRETVTDTDAVTVSESAVTVSKNELSPQLLKKKELLLKLLKLLFERNIEGIREEKSSRDESTLTDEVTI